ncbi:MAG: triose-phosphate isomerase [Chloroflexota bacterium]
MPNRRGPNRRRLIAGNWKMNGTLAEARTLAQAIVAEVPAREGVDVAVCPPFTCLAEVAKVVRGSHVGLGGQNMYFELGGAFTGEISPTMLLDAGCRYVILGHSERRRQMGETSALVNRKLKLAIQSGLRPIVCVGETLPERTAGDTERVVAEQVRESLAGIEPAEALASVVLAYEPVWAIGTGQVATPEQAQAVHRFIRGLLPPAIAADTVLQYGGSVTPESAAGLLAQPDIDGALVGGASLKASSFAAIAAIAAIAAA